MTEREEMRIKSALLGWIRKRMTFHDTPELNELHIHALVDELFILVVETMAKK